MKSITKFAQLIEQQKPLWRSKHTTLLKEENSEKLANTAAFALQLCLTEGIPITSTCVAIGRMIKPSSHDNEELFLIGMSLLYVLCKHNYLSIDRGSSFEVKEDIETRLFKAWHNSKNKSNKNKKGDYSPKMFIVPKTKRAKEFIDDLVVSVDVKIATQSRNIILTECPEDWDGFYHPQLGPLVSKSNRRMRRLLTPERCPEVFKAVNKLQSTAYEINDEVLQHLETERAVILKAMRKSSANAESYGGKLFELDNIISLAKQFIGKKIYLAVQLDFRGRFYYSSAYLNRGGSDPAKALLRLFNKEELGAKGWNNLLVEAINLRGFDGEDKLTKAEKLDIADDSLDKLVNAEGWLDADKPIQYYAVCNEIKKAIESGDEYTYKTGVLCGLDASTSGPMIMGLAAQDRNTMRLTNVLRSITRFDPYLEVGRVVLRKLQEMKAELAPVESIERPNGDELFDRVLWLNRNTKQLRSSQIKFFLNLFKDETVLRKFMKRPVMIIGYAGEEWCVAEAIWDDFFAKTPGLNPVGCKLLGDLIYKAYAEVLPACFQIMEGLKKLGGIIHKRDEDLRVDGVYSNFPMMQNYRKPIVKRVSFKYKSKEMKFNVIVGWNKRDYHSTVSGIAPNCIHNGDSELLIMTVNSFKGQISVNHDAFYVLPNQVDDLSKQLRYNTFRLGADFDILNNIVSRYDVSLEELGIEKHQLQEDFDPVSNEFCYA